MISVIVPIYNIEKYLSQCIDSILAQSYPDFELIMVDDGSPDSCGFVCDEYALKDPRIRVVHKKNGGLSDARNAGIEIAKGEYITFVDGDDVLHIDFLALLIDGMKSHDADVAVCKPLIFTDVPVWGSVSGKTAILDRYQAMERIFLPRPEWIIETAWGKLYRKEVVGQLRFPVGRQHEDVFTTYRFFYEARKLVLIDRKLYGYRTRGGSITNQPFRVQRLDAVEAGKEALEFVRENCPSLLQQVRFYLAVICLCLINQMALSGYPDKAVFKCLRKDIFKLCHPFRNRHLSYKQKIWLVVLKVNISLYKAGYRWCIGHIRARNGERHGE